MAGCQQGKQERIVPSAWPVDLFYPRKIEICYQSESEGVFWKRK
jgi:hypothetical protein